MLYLSDPFCDSCGTIETIEHFFVECEEVRKFWDELFEKMNSKLGPLNQSICTATNILFGTLKALDVVNLIVLTAKQFIVGQRFKEEEIRISIFLKFIERTFQMERCLAKKDGKIERFKDKWLPFIDEHFELNI